MEFKLHSDYQPTGDQPEAIEALVEGFREGNQAQTLLGVTGSGKTFTMANIIQQLGRPTLVIAHNKTLAAQLYGEFKEFFPENAVEYFVSYYDYYQPEAYVPQTDTYIEKDSSINDEIDKLRLSATASLTSRNDVIVVSSVSCIYGLGSPIDFKEMALYLRVGEERERNEVLRKLVQLHYDRSDIDFHRSTFRVRGDVLDIFPAQTDAFAYRVEFFGDEIDRITQIDPLTGKAQCALSFIGIFPASHYVTPEEKVAEAVDRIEKELEEQVKYFRSEDKLLEAQRISERTNYDVEMLRETGFCSGIENYSRHMEGREAGTPPQTLLDYFPDEYLIIIDESHMTLPQLRAMYNGDQSRKTTLVDYGFRLPSAKDNRPLRFPEFEKKVHQIVFTSATPGDYEYSVSKTVAEQVVRPTGLLDPEIEVRPLKNQIDDLMEEIRKVAAAGDRVLVTTLTKRSAEDLTAYLHETGIRVEYLHSDIDALERVAILGRLRKGEFDVLIGINLLREGLDFPEVALVAILDADKEGFLRSTTSLVQTAGRCARHVKGRVILYADHETDAIRETIDITKYHREKQIAYNKAHHITPKSVKRKINESVYVYTAGKDFGKKSVVPVLSRDGVDQAVLDDLRREMMEAADALEFERAAYLRDQIKSLEKKMV